MKIKLNDKEYTLKIRGGRPEWHDENYILVPTSLVPNLEATLPQEIRHLLFDLKYSPEEAIEMAMRRLNDQSSLELRIFLLHQLPDENLDLTTTARLTGIKREILSKRARKRRLETYKKKRRNREYRIVPRNKVLALIFENKPVIEGWIPFQEVARKYNLCQKTLVDWTLRREIKGQKSPGGKWYLSPSSEKIVAERAGPYHK